MKTRVPKNAAAFEARFLLAGAYDFGRLREDRPVLVHAVWIDASGREVGEKTLCKKISIDKVVDPFGMDDPAEPVTCPTCFKRIEGAREIPRAFRGEIPK